MDTVRLGPSSVSSKQMLQRSFHVQRENAKVRKPDLMFSEPSIRFDVSNSWFKNFTPVSKNFTPVSFEGTERFDRPRPRVVAGLLSLMGKLKNKMSLSYTSLRTLLRRVLTRPIYRIGFEPVISKDVGKC